jgi:hypothetical protein
MKSSRDILLNPYPTWEGMQKFGDMEKKKEKKTILLLFLRIQEN